jgi:MFS transporter, DHA2 family, multidrug resistance protein
MAVQQQQSNEPNPYRWIILIGLVTAAIMEILDTTIVNVALPQIMGNLDSTRDEIGWVSTGYILSNVVILPMTAWLSGRFGRKRYLFVSILIFIASSMMCGLSHTLLELVIFRICQGAGGAALISTAQATLVEIFPRNQQGTIQAVFGLGLIVAPTLGPALGGWITDNFSWPWCFFINLPIGIVSATIVYMFLPDAQNARRTGAVDWAGIGLLATGLGSLQYVLEEGKRYDWFDDPTITKLFCVAIVCLIAFIAWELWPSNKQPIVDLRVLKDRGLSSALIIGLALGFGLYGGVFIYPLFAQNVLGFSPTTTGLVLVPGGLASGFGMIFCGRVLQKGFDPRKLIAFGITLFVISMWQLSHLTTQTGVQDTEWALGIRGLALGFLFIPITVAAFSGLQGRDIQQGAALFNLARQLGGSIGIAVLSTYLDTMGAFHRSDLIGNISSGNLLYQQRLHQLTALFEANGPMNPPAAGAAAVASINGALTAQAATMSYNDAFLLIGVCFLFAFPAVLLLKRRKPGAGPGGMAH